MHYIKQKPKPKNFTSVFYALHKTKVQAHELHLSILLHKTKAQAQMAFVLGLVHVPDFLPSIFIKSPGIILINKHPGPKELERPKYSGPTQSYLKCLKKVPGTNVMIIKIFSHKYWVKMLASSTLKGYFCT
jgi:hypothetical protein